MRQGAKYIRLEVSPTLRQKIADIAGKSGAALFDRPLKALDLNNVADPPQACREWLEKKQTTRKSGPSQ